MARFQFANENHWRFAYDINETAEYLNPQQTRYTRLPPIIPGFLINSNVLAIYATSNTSPPHHKFAGLVSQLIQTAITIGPDVDAESNTRKKIWLNRMTIIEWDNLSNDYGLRFDIPYWIQHINLSIYEYIGPVESN